MAAEPLAVVAADLASYVERAERLRERTTITRDGRPVAVLIAADDLAVLEDTIAVLGDPEAVRALADSEGAWTRGKYTDGVEVARLLDERAQREKDASDE